MYYPGTVAVMCLFLIFWVNFAHDLILTILLLKIMFLMVFHLLFTCPHNGEQHIFPELSSQHWSCPSWWRLPWLMWDGPHFLFSLMFGKKSENSVVTVFLSTSAMQANSIQERASTQEAIYTSILTVCWAVTAASITTVANVPQGTSQPLMSWLCRANSFCAYKPLGFVHTNFPPFLHYIAGAKL